MTVHTRRQVCIVLAILAIVTASLGALFWHMEDSDAATAASREELVATMVGRPEHTVNADHGPALMFLAIAGLSCVCAVVLTPTREVRSDL